MRRKFRTERIDFPTSLQPTFHVAAFWWNERGKGQSMLCIRLALRYEAMAGVKDIIGKTPRQILYEKKICQTSRFGNL